MVALRKIRIVSVVLALVFFVTGCNLQLQVQIDVNEDGSGLVTAGVGLDPLAQDQTVFADLESILRTSDLAASGWDFEAIGRSADGREWYEASKPFLSPEDLQGVLAELTSSPKAFSGWTITLDSSRKKRVYSVNGKVDLSEGFNIFTDSELSSLLEEPPLGVSLETLEAELGQKPESTVAMRVVLNLPDTGEQFYDIPLGQQLSIEATGESIHRVSQILGWVIKALLVLLAISLFMAAVNWFLDARYAKKQPPRRPTPVTSQMPGVSSPSSATSTKPETSVRLLVIDMHKVLFVQSNDPQNHLLSFIHEKGGNLDEDEIVELHRQGTLGRLSSGDFWQGVGADGEPEELDKEYIRSFDLRSGAKDFLQTMHKRNIPISVVTNDFAEWSHGLRDLYGLHGMDPWVVSAESGVRKPNPAAFEMLRKAAGVPFQSCLVIDGSENSLDAAANLGMKTVLLSTEGESTPSTDHPIVKKFSEFTRR